MRATSTPTAREVRDLGEAVGRIAGIAARSLHESFPNLDLEDLAEAFTRDSVIEFIGRRYLAAIEQGKTPGEAAGDAATALIRAWADARLEVRARLDREKAARRDGGPWGPMVLCGCGTEVRDEAKARQAHQDEWHSDAHPATWSTL